MKNVDWLCRIALLVVVLMQQAHAQPAQNLDRNTILDAVTIIAFGLTMSSPSNYCKDADAVVTAFRARFK